MEFVFDPEKNTKLLEERGISFYQIIEAIAEEKVLLDFTHPNSGKYPDQRILVIAYNNYTYCVPYSCERGQITLKTVFPSRKFLYLLEGDNEIS